MQVSYVPLEPTMEIHLRCSCGCEFQARGADALKVIAEADKWQQQHLNCQQPQAGDVLPWLVVDTERSEQ